MSGFELERQNASERLAKGCEITTSHCGEELNRDLLTRLQQSSDIVKDLWSLYEDRPYVYARVMQQLGRVMGKSQLRKLHSDVAGRSQAAAQERSQRQATIGRYPVLRSSTNGSVPVVKSSLGKSGANDAAENAVEKDEGEKEFFVNVPRLGIDNVKVTVLSAERSQSISASDLPIPFLKDLRGAVSFNDKKASKIEASATFEAALMENATATLTLTRVGESSEYAPSVTFSDVKLNVAGLNGMSASLELGDGDAKVKGTVHGSGDILQNVRVSGEGTLQTGGSDTSMSGSLGVEGGESEGEISFSGSVELNAQSGAIANTKGVLKLTNINKLADPAGSIELQVDYDGENFKAELLDSVTFAPHTYGGGESEGGESEGGKATTVQVTVNSASYDGALDASFTVGADFGGIAHAEGSVEISRNKIASGQLILNATDVPIIGEKAFVTASLDGNVDVDESGFSGAATGSANFVVGGQNIAINLDSVVFDSSGQFEGKISLSEPTEFKPFKFESFVAAFSSSQGLTSADGILSLDMNRIKSDEGGVAISYADGELKAAGVLKLLGVGGDGGGDAMATCEFSATLSSDKYSGKGKFTVDNDYRVGTTKLCICAGAWAEVNIEGQDIAPIAFEGDYNYGHTDGGGAADAVAASAPEAAGAGKTPLVFCGKFQNCTYDVNTGALNGAATANLEHDFKIQSKQLDLTINAEYGKTSSEMNVVIKDSAISEINGDLAFNAEVPVIGKDDALSLHGDIKGFAISVPQETFSGLIDAKLRRNFSLMDNAAEGGNSLKLLHQETGVKVDIADNVVTGIEFDGAAQLDIQSEIIKGGKGAFKIFVKDAVVNMDTLAISSPSIGIKPQKDITFVIGKDEASNTEITVAKTGGMTANLTDNLVNSINVDASFTGKKRALRTPDAIEFQGSTAFDILNLQSSPSTSGTISVTTVSPCELFGGEGVDRLTLLEGSGIDLAIDGNVPTTVNGQFELDYRMSPNDYLSGGLGARISGKELTYQVAEGTFGGTLGVTPLEDIVFQSQSGDGVGASFTLKAAGTELNGVMAANKLTSLDGSAAFEASAVLGNLNHEASVDFKEGTAEFDVNVDTGKISSLKVSSKIDLDLQLSEKIGMTSDDVEVQAEFDAEGLMSVDFFGQLKLSLQLSDGTEAIFTIVPEDLKYLRGLGMTGGVKLMCEEEIRIGEISQSAANQASGSYEYGFSTGFISASIEENTIKTLGGDAGLYLREQDVDDPLEVSGNVEFSFNVEEDSLDYAHGEVTVKQKTLKHSDGGDLILKESTVDVEVNDGCLDKVSGTVLLALSDSEIGEYLYFESNGEFDCLNSDSVSGDVKAWFVKDKKIHTFDSGVMFYVTPTGDAGETRFDCTITDNVIESFSGAINVMFRTSEDEDFFAGSVSGSYDSETKKVVADGMIRLCRDLPFPDENGQFILGEGSNGSAHIDGENIDNITGSLTVKIKSPKTAEGGGDVTIDVTSTGTVDVKNNLVEEFTGSAELNGEFPLGTNLSLTSLNATVRIEKNVLQEISGGAGIKYSTAGFAIEGNVDEIRWTKGQGDAEDSIYFVGDLSVTGFDGKLTGTTFITYDSETNSVTCGGTLDFKITDWLSGEVSVKFDNGNGWNNPEIAGRIETKEIEMLPGTTLMGYSSEDDSPEASIPIVGPLKAVVGVGFGASIDMQPLRISGEAEILPFRLDKLKQGCLPDFDMAMEISTGLDLQATVAPYIGLEADLVLGKAGLRVKGKAEAKANADATLAGHLKGGPDGLSGSVGLGFSVAASATLTVIPEVYAEGGESAYTWPITEWTFDLGNIFSFDWGKNYAFGDAPAASSGDCEKVDMSNASANTEAVEAKSGEVESRYGSKQSAPPVGDGKESPKLDSPDTVGKESFGKNVEGGSDSMGGMMETIRQVTDIAKGLGAIGEAIGFVKGLIGSFTLGGPLGVGVYVAAKILAGDLTLENIKDNVKKIKDGAKALKDLITGNADFLMSLLPKPIAKLVEFFQDIAKDGLIAKVVDAIEKGINNLGYPMNRILAPVVDFARGRQKQLGEIAKLFAEPISGTGIVKMVFAVLGFAVDSIDALISTCRQSWSIFCTIFKECIATGDIYVRYKERWGLDEYFWQVKIPGLCHFSGEGKYLTRAAAEFLVGFAGVPRQKIS